MKKNLATHSTSTRGVSTGLTASSIGLLLAVLAFAFSPSGIVRAQGTPKDQPAAQVTLNSEEALKMAEALKKLANRSTEGLVQTRHADGSVSMDLQGRFQSVTLAKKNADGTISTTCVDNARAGAAFLGIDPRLVDLAKDSANAQGKPDKKKADEQ